MPSPPERFKQIEDWSPEDHYEAMRAARRGEDYRPETAEFKQYKADGLRALGLDDDAARVETQPKAVEEMTPADYYADLRGGAA
jgi:hypothetical protein